MNIHIDEKQLPPGSRFFAKAYSDDSMIEEMRRMLGIRDGAALTLH